MSDQPEQQPIEPSLHSEVEDRFGVLPNFFRLAPDAPEITENLWGFAKFGYLDNPLPSLFKERLFVFLSQFCEVRYCISRHVGFLVGLGRPAGDRECPPETIEQIVRLLRRPLPSGEALDPYVEFCETRETALAELPEAESFSEEAIFACATHVFLQTSEASRCLEALRQALKSDTLQHLLVFVTFVRTAHFWTKVHPELKHEADITELLTIHEALAECVLHDPAAANAESTQVLLNELTELRKERDQAELLRVTLASIGDAVIATDPHGRITLLNAVAEELTGWTSRDAFGEPLESVFKIVNEQTRQPVENPALRALRDGKVVGLANHTILIAKDGTERPIDDSAAPIRDATNKLAGSVLIFRDVTERRSAERQVEDALHYVESIVDTVKEPLLVLDENLQVQSANRSFYQTFAVSPEETEDRQLHELGNGQWNLAALRSLLKDVLSRNKMIQDFEVERQFPGIGLRTMRLNARKLYRESSRTELILLAMDDITERKQVQKSERLLASVVESSDDGIVSKTLDGIIQSWNAAAERIFGYTAQQAIGQHISLLIPEERASEEDQIIERLRAGERVEHFETVRLRSDGQAIHVSLTISPIKDAAGTVVGASKIARDISDRKRAEEAMRENEARKTAILNTALDAIVTVDHFGHVVEFNPAAEHMFGFSRDDVIGRDMAELIVPPALRDRHRQGLAQYLETGEETILNRRLELSALRSDGSEFPVEITVTRISKSEPPLFTGFIRDITERMQAEQALKEARSRLESTLAAAEIGTWEYDPINNSVHADKNLAAMFGVNPHDQSGVSLETYLMAIHPQDRDHVIAALEDALAGGAPYEVEYRIVHPPGNERVRWVVARGRVERNKSGQAVRMPGVVVDITERKQTEAELRKSEEQRRLALDSAELGSWNIDPATNRLESDDRFRTIFHGSTEPINYEEAFAAIHPDDRERVREKVAAATNPDNRVRYAEEYRVIHPNGAIRWVFGKGRANFESTETGPRLVSFDGTVMDITEHRRIQDIVQEHEQRFRVLLEQVKDYAIFMTDPEGRATSWNEGVLRVLGFDEDEFIGQDIVPLIFTPEDRASGVPAAELDEAAATGSASDDRWMLRKDGTRFWAAGVTTGLHDRSGKLLGFMKVMRDQTERKQMEDELRQYAADLSEADRRKTEFLATLGHELRNPLAPIRTGLDIMKMAKDDPETVEEVRSTMERQVQQMVRLIDDLLDISRITQGKMVLRTCRVNLAEIIRSAVEATRTFIDEAGHELTVNLPPQPIFLDADPNRLAQVLSNLLNNSSKYTPDGGQISLSCTCQDREVTVTVKDNGLGIPADMLENIFEMFTQIDRPIEEGYTGLGIGLTLVKQLVEMHGGTVTVRSDGAGQGSEFSICLPILFESTVDESVQEQPTIVPKMRILVVDDNKAAATMLKMVVKMLGNEVRTAHDGHSAIEVAADFLPDVVLMDLGMPKMNGYEAARHIREQTWGKDMLLVALTGWGQDEDKQRTEQAGFDHHLVKPAEPAALQQLLANHQQRLGDSSRVQD